MSDPNDIPTFNTLDQWLEAWGFVHHPFERLVADDDEYLENYFHIFPYFNVVKEPKCTFLFLKRGAGKSANRKYLQILCDKSLKQIEDTKLSVVYTDFHRLFQHDQVTLIDHIEEILKEAVPKLYDLTLKSFWQDLPQKLSIENKRYFFWFIVRYSDKLQPESIAQQIYQIQDLNEEARNKIITGELKLAIDLLGKGLTLQDFPQNSTDETKYYNLKNIRALLTRGFTTEELRRLCYDVPHFRQVYEQFAQDTGKDKIIDRLIEYADEKLQLETLLSLAQELNPAQYEEHEPYYQDFTTSPTTSGSIYKKSPISKDSSFNDLVIILQKRLQEIDDLTKFSLSPLKLMARFAEIAQELNVKYIYILIDRIDEYTQIDSYTKAANMLKPLLEAIPLLEMYPYAFKFFLPFEMRDELANHLRPDRFIIHDYTWKPTNLDELLKGRLDACSDKGKIPDQGERQSFTRLFEEEVRTGKDIVEEMIQYANGSPRNLLKLAKMIFEEHSDSENFLLSISKKTYQKVLSDFAAEQLRLSGLHEPLVGQLADLNLSNRHTPNELLSRSGLKDPDNLIKQWQKDDTNFHLPHFSLIDIIKLLNKSRSEARDIAREWEDKELVSSHYKILDENLARYLYTKRGEE